jgi:hypothetical protein
MTSGRDKANKGRDTDSNGTTQSPVRGIYLPELSIIKLHAQLQRWDRAKSANFRHNPLHGRAILDGSAADLILRGPGRTVRITLTHMRLWMETYNWILGPRSTLHNIPDPNDVPPE